MLKDSMKKKKKKNEAHSETVVKYCQELVTIPQRKSDYSHEELKLRERK